MTDRLSILRPDDWHLHLRDGSMLGAVAAQSARHFARAIIMPNLVPPVVTGAQAAAYRQRILNTLPAGTRFRPLMTLYLTEATEPDDVERSFAEGTAHAVKLYPAGSTTNSHSGVRDIDKIMPVLEKMTEIGMPLCVHGETTDPEVDIFDREAVFIEKVLEPLRRRLGEVRIILEHITSEQGIAYVESNGSNIAGTLTAHHLVINRNAMFSGGFRPHYYCLPVAKRERHRQTLVAAATGGNEKFFLGTDSAPHVISSKVDACGCAGIFTAVNAIACVTQIFEDDGALGRLENFVSRNGASYYRMPVSKDTITLIRRDQPVSFPEKLKTPAGPVQVFDPLRPIYWEVEA